MEYLIQCVNVNQQSDEIRQVLNQICLNFVHSNSSDDEMTIGINCITEVCKRAPHVLLDSEDGLSMLRELMSYSSNKSVLRSHNVQTKGSKTSAATRKGVIMASRALINYFRKTAPGYLDKKYLDRDSSMYLQNLKKLDLDTKFINFDEEDKPITRIANIDLIEKAEKNGGELESEYSEEDSESSFDDGPSKHQRLH